MPQTISDLSLSPNQQNLLVAALTSNQPSEKQRGIAAPPKSSQGASNAPYPPAAMSNNSAPGSGRLDYDDSPFLESFLDGENEDSFDFDDQGQMFGDLPEDGSEDNGTADPGHLHDKRKSMGAQDDDDVEGGGKRREGDDKQARKPGRKPLTSEPTSVSSMDMLSHGI